MSFEEPAEAFMMLPGQVITRVRRIYYVVGGTPDESVGPVELQLDGERIVLVDSGSDGESLKITYNVWIDPFADPLSDENRAFVERSGKWTAFDVSAIPPYNQPIGRKVVAVDKVTSPLGKVVGVILRAEGGYTLRADVEADDLYVQHC